MPAALVPLVLLLAAAPDARRTASHPDVGANASPDACQGCHAEATPEVVREWESGAHGLLLVKCFVCHGSTGEDFARRPGPRRCDGCHPGEVASSARPIPARRAARAAAPADCFSCHAPHGLAAPGRPNPHR